MSGVGLRESVDVTVVVPTFNEKENIAVLIGRFEAMLGRLRWEVIVVDDDSPDGTAQAVQRIAGLDPRVRCLRRTDRRGLAGACIEGMLAAQAEIVIVIDADLQHDVALIPALHAAVAGGSADVAVASRFLDETAVKGLSKGRLMASRIAVAACRILLQVRLSDPMSGYFATRRTVIEDLAPDLSVDGFKLLLDIVATSNSDLRLLEIPYTFQARAKGRSKLGARVSLDFAALLVAKLFGPRTSPLWVKLFCSDALAITVQMAALWLLIEGTPLSFGPAQLCAFLAAATMTCGLHNALAFSDRRVRGWKNLRKLLGFYADRAPSCLANIAAGAGLYGLSGRWWLAGFTSAAVGAAWTHSGSKRIAATLGMCGSTSR